MSDDLLEKIYHKVEKLSDDMTDIKVISAQNTSSLEEHMRRSDLLEEHLEVVREEVRPLKTHVDMVNGALKVFGVLGVIASIAKFIMMFIT